MYLGQGNITVRVTVRVYLLEWVVREGRYDVDPADVDLGGDAYAGTRSYEFDIANDAAERDIEDECLNHYAIARSDLGYGDDEAFCEHVYRIPAAGDRLLWERGRREAGSW